MNNKYFLGLCSTLFVYSIFIWYPVLNFEFLRAYEPYWLGSAVNTNFSFLDLYQSHSYLYFFDYYFFGWNPMAWYLTGILTHTFGTLAFLFYLNCVLQKIEPYINQKEFIWIYGFIFVGSFVYLDVVSWASFNSYYGLLLSLISLSACAYIPFDSSNKNKLLLLLSLLLFFIALLIRETALYTIFLISTYFFIANRFLFKNNKFSLLKKYLVSISPYIAVILLFLYFRSMVGGVSGDMTDDNVRSRISLIANHEYLKLFTSIGLTFLRNTPTLFIPFEWLNAFKAYVLSINSSPPVDMYFYSTIGLIFYLPLTFICIKSFIKNSSFGNILMFGWSIITFSLLFTAIAIPSTDTNLATIYNYFTRRYNYFAFVGGAVIWTVIIIKVANLSFLKFRFFKLVPASFCILTIMLFGNFIITRNAINTVFITEHSEYRSFIESFRKICCNFDTKKVIYYPPASSDINDYLFAMLLTKDWVFKDVNNIAAKKELWEVENQLDRVFDKLKKGVVHENDMLFLGYTKKDGLIDFKKQILTYYRNPINIPIILNQEILLPSNDGIYPVLDIPYGIEMQLSERFNFIAQNSNIQYKDFMQWYAVLKIKTGPTLSQRQGEEFRKYAGINAIDLNIENKFYWGSDGTQNHLELSSKDSANIYGLWIASPDKKYLPSIYEVLDSQGNKIKTKEQFEPWGLLILFDKKINDNKIKLVIKNTYSDYPLIEDINIVSESINSDLNRGIKIPKIIDQIKKEYSSIGFWVKISYQVEIDSKSISKQFDYFVKLNNGNNKILIHFPEDERSNDSLNSFLRARITSVKVEVPLEIEKSHIITKTSFVSIY